MFQPRFCPALVLLLGALLPACALVDEHPERDAPDLSGSQDAKTTRAHMRRLLVGSFTSGAQAAADPENYFDIRLEVVPIWTNREDGPWLYVEQAAATALERPYRQRVYRLEGGPLQGFRSVVYELPGDPKYFAGAFRSAQPLAELEPGDLQMLEGCTVYLALQPDMTVLGGTRADECGTEWGGAKYATSEVTLTPDWMESWDRGYDAEGNQVWGATEGAYRFDRVR